MASSRVTSPPVSLKDRIAALEKKKNTNSPQSTSPPPLVSPSPARSLSPTGGAAATNNVNNLRDKITKFEKKGGTPIPRGSFGAAVPPLDVPGATRRVGELYGNRVPGLDRPTHAPVVGVRNTSTPLRPQMTGGDILGLRPQMTGADASSLRPQFTGDGRFQRRTTSTYGLGGDSLSGDEETQYAPFVPPTSLPSEVDESLATSSAIHETPDIVDAPSDPTSTTVSEDEAPTAASEIALGRNDPKVAPVEDVGVEGQPASHQPDAPIVEVIKAPEVLDDAPEPKIGLKSQGSAETLRETAGSAGGPTSSGASSVLIDASSAREASTTKRDTLEVDFADRSSASIDLQDVAIVTQPQVYLTSSTPRSVVVDPSPPSSQEQTQPERATKVTQRPVTQYEVPKSTPYVEPEFNTPKPAPSNKSTFTAVVHRRTTVQSIERPATTYESSSVPAVTAEPVSAPAPRIPVQTVTDLDISFSAEDLGSLLADAALLEEALNLGPVSTPKRNEFSQASLASTLSVGPKDTQGKHHRTGSQMTIKAGLREDSQPAAEKLEASPAPAPVDNISVRDKAAVQPLSSPPNVIVAEPEPAPIGEFADFGFQELVLPSERGQIPTPQVGDEIPPTPPPKSPPSSYLSSMRSNAAKRMSSLLPEGTRRSVSSSEDSAPLGTPPSQDLYVQTTRSPRHSKSYNALRDDTSQKSRSTGGRDDSSFVSHESKRSKWSFKSSSKSSKGLSRATTFADRIWPGSNKRNRTASDNSAESPSEVSPSASSPSKSAQSTTLGVPPQLPSSPSILEAPDSRPISWLSETSSALSSPGFDDQFFDQFPTVPGQAAARSLPSLNTATSSKPKVGKDGTLLTPPDRGSSLSHMFASSARQR